MPSDEKKNDIIDQWFSSTPKTTDDEIPLLDAELIEDSKAVPPVEEKKSEPVQEVLVAPSQPEPVSERLKTPQEIPADKLSEIISWQEIISMLEDEAKTRGQVGEASVLFNSAGIILSDKLRQPRNAAIDFQNAFNINMAYLPNIKSAVRLFYYLGNYQMAVQLLQVATQTANIKNKSGIYFEIALIKLYFLNDINGAREAILLALQENPSEVAFLNFIKNIYYRNRNNTELVNILEQLSHLKLPEHYIKTILFTQGKILEERLSDIDLALKSYERIFMLDPSDRDAVDCIENILMAKKAYGELVSILKQHANALPPERRIEVYNKLVILSKEYLGDSESTIYYLSELLRLRENDLSVLDGLLREYSKKGEYEKITDILKKITELTTDKNVLANIYFKLGTIYEENLSDELQAIEYYKKIVDISSAYQPAYASLGRLLSKHGKWEDLVRLMEIEIAQTEDVLQKVARYYKMAEIIETKIQDLNRAISVYKKILQLRSSYLPALKALGTLYGKLNMYQELIDMYEEEIKITEDREQIAFLLDKIGITYEEKLNNKEKAAETYRRILDIIPDHLPTIRTLARLYARLERWEDLIKMCEIESELIHDQIQVVSLLHKIGETYEEHLKNIDEAVKYYKKALMISPNYLPALKSLGNIYLYQGRYEELIDMYKREIEVTRNQPHNISLYHKIAQIYEDKLNMPERAISTYEEILLLDPYNLPALNALKNIYLNLNSYDRYVDILLKEEHLMSDVNQKAYLFFQVGEIYITRLKNIQKGIEFLKRSLLLNKENAAARVLLIDTLRQNGRYSELADVLIEFASGLSTDTDKIEIYWELAQIFLFKLKETNRAIMYLEKIITIEPAYVKALTLLSIIYREEKEYIKLITILEKMTALDLPKELLISYHLELASLKESAMKMPSESYPHYIKVLELDPTNRIAAEALERVYSKVMDIEGLDVLYRNYISRLDLDTEERVVNDFRTAVILLGSPATVERGVNILLDTIKTNPDYLPAHFVLRDYYLKSGKYREFVKTSSFIASKVQNLDVKKRLLVEAAAILEERLKEIEKATSIYLMAFDISPADANLFRRLEGLLIQQKRDSDLINLYRRRISATNDNSERSLLYLRIARILEKEPGRIDEAISAYKSAISLDPYNEDALVSLSNHLIQSRSYDDAIEYLNALAGFSKSPEILKNTFLSLGTLLYLHRQDLNSALFNFQKVVSIDPNNIPALEYMASIYLAQGNYEYAIKTYHYLLSISKNPAKNLEYIYTLAGIYENNLSSVDGAIEVLKSGLSIDPTNEQLLSRLVSLCERVHKIEELLSIYESVISSFPEHERINAIPLMIKKAEIYQNIQKNFKEAEKELKRIIQIAPNNILAHSMLATLYSSDPNTYPQAIVEYRTLIQIDPFNIDYLRAISRLFNQLQMKDAVFCSIGTLIALRSATNDEEFAHGETRHRIEAIQGILLRHEDVDLYVVHHRARGLFREILSVINDELHDIFDIGVEKYGPEVKKTRMTKKSNDRLRGRCDDVAKILNAGDYNLYIADKQGVLSFVEATDPPSIVIGGEFAKLPPDEQRFGFARMLYYIMDKQIAAQSMSEQELQYLLNAILLLIAPDRFSSTIKDEASLNYYKRLNKGISRKSRNILMSMQDRINDLSQTDIRTFKKALSMSANRVGLLITSSPQSAISYIYRILNGGKQLPNTYDSIFKECNRNEEIRDIVAYSVSDEFLKLREKIGLCLK
jgi:tetratricopeptide (TPR) repeat protein